MRMLLFFSMSLALGLAAPLQSASATDLNQYELLGEYITPTNIYDVRVRGNLAYVAYYVDLSTSVMEVLDVSNPARITSLGQVTLSHAANDYIVPFALVLSGDSLYVSMYYGGFVIIDVSDPRTPGLVGAYAVNGTSGDALQGMVVDGGYLYAGWDYRHGLGVFDVRDASAPELLAETGRIGLARMVLKKDQFVFVSTYYNGAIQIFDVSNPAAPSLSTSIPTPGSSYYIGDIRGDLFALADRSATYGLRLYSVADPTHPVQLGQLDTASLGFGDVGGAKLFGSEAFVTFNHRVAVVDVSDPSAPVLGSMLDLASNNSLLFDYDGKRLFMPGEHGLSIYGLPPIPMTSFANDQFRYQETGTPSGRRRTHLSSSGRYVAAVPGDIDLMTQEARLSINNLEFVVGPGQWRRQGERFVYDSSAQATPSWSLELRPSVGQWSLEVWSDEWGTLVPSGEVRTSLQLGNQVGATSLVPEFSEHTRYNRVWAYRLH